MIDLGLTREQILRKYSPEEYEEALRSIYLQRRLCKAEKQGSLQKK